MVMGGTGTGDINVSDALRGDGDWGQGLGTGVVVAWGDRGWGHEWERCWDRGAEAGEQDLAVKGTRSGDMSDGGCRGRGLGTSVMLVVEGTGLGVTGDAGGDRAWGQEQELAERGTGSGDMRGVVVAGGGQGLATRVMVTSGGQGSRDRSRRWLRGSRFEDTVMVAGGDKDWGCKWEQWGGDRNWGQEGEGCARDRNWGQDRCWWGGDRDQGQGLGTGDMGGDAAGGYKGWGHSDGAGGVRPW